MMLKVILVYTALVIIIALFCAGRTKYMLIIHTKNAKSLKIPLVRLVANVRG